MAATRMTCPLDGKIVARIDRFDSVDYAETERDEVARQNGHVCYAADDPTYSVPGDNVPELRDLIGAALSNRQAAGTAGHGGHTSKGTTVTEPTTPATRTGFARLRIERSTHLPAGAYNRWHVYDFDAGQIARRTLADPSDGRLAYFRTRREAQAFVTDAYLAAAERERAAMTPAEREVRERETFGRL
jgi:hypothetical protein